MAFRFPSWLRATQLFVVMLLLVPALAAATAQQQPQELVKSTAQLVLDEVLERKDELKESPEKIYLLVEKHVLPSFDFELMSKLVLGKYWKRASEEEQLQFTDAFRQLLVRTYATALLNYSGQEIAYPDFDPKPGAERVNVPTQVFASEGAPPVPIDYSLYQRDEAWKVYDVKIDGISLVSNYRSTFAGQIKRYGLDGLIDKIEEKNRKGEE